MKTHGPTLVFGDMNARLYHVFPGEEEYLGPHAILNPVQQVFPKMNRFLLMQLCASCELRVENTFFDKSLSEKVTYYDDGRNALDLVSLTGFAKLDILLVNKDWAHLVVDVRSECRAPIPSHHFLVMARLALEVPKADCLRTARFDATALRSQPVAQRFAQKFRQHMDHHNVSSQRLDSRSQDLTNAFLTAAEETLPSRNIVPKRPWISTSTLQMIEDRRHMRENGATAEAERAMTRSIRRSAKQDREQWLTDMAGSRDWSDIRALRGKLKKKQGRLHNLQGIPVSSEERAETFAEYLEKVQWTVRPAAVVPQRPPIREKLEVRKDNFSYDELSAVLRKLRGGAGSRM